MSELRDLDIEVELEVDASELIAADARINALIQNIKRIDDVIKINVKLDVLGALQDLTRLQSIIEVLESQVIKPKIDIDIAAATAKLALLQSQINNMSGEHIPIIITSNGNGNNGPPSNMHSVLNLDTDNATQKLMALQTQIQTLDNLAKITIDMDIDGAMTKLAAVEARLANIRNHTIDVDVDAGAAMAQIAALQALLAQLNGGGPLPPFPNFGGGGGGISTPFGGLLGMATKASAALLAINMLPTLIGTLGTAGYAIGALTNGVVALGSAIASAGIGMGAFGLVAFTSISKLYDENAKLTQSQRELKTHIDSLSYSYSMMEKAAQPLVYDTIGKGVNTIKTAIHMMTPIVDDAAIAIGGLFHDLNRSLQGERMTEFFDYIERSTGPMINNIGSGLGYALQGVANTMVAMEPLTNWMGQGFENMFKKFADWSAIQKDAGGFDDFIDNTREALSAIGDIAGGAFTGIKEFFGAFEFTAVDGLEWLGEKMQDFAKWSSELDTNRGFQDLLEQIKIDGPIVAEVLGDIAQAVIDVVKAINDINLGGEGTGIFGWLDNIRDFEPFDIGNMFKMGGILRATGIDFSAMLGLDALEEKISSIDIGGALSTAASNAGEWWGGIREGLSSAFEGAFESVSSWFASIGESVSGWFSNLDIGGSISTAFDSLNLGNLDLTNLVSSIEWGDFIPKFTWPSITSIDWSSFIPSFSWSSLPTFDWKSFIPSFSWPSLPSFSWKSLIPTFTFPSIPQLNWSMFISKFNWPILPNLSWSSFISRFNWPSLPSFSWTSFINRFNWPKLPSFSWSSFISKFNWPTLPKFSWPKISVSDLLGKVSNFGGAVAKKVGFDTGIGRVPRDMEAIIHKNEAILPAHQAETLRNIGVIQGDGRYPDLNLEPFARNESAEVSISTTAATASPTYVTAAQSSASSSTTVQVGDIHITVQGGGDPRQASINVREELEKFFASLSDTIDLRVEG